MLSSSAGLTAQIAEIGVALPPLEPTTEDQFELGAASVVGPLHVAVTGYYRTSDNLVHTTVCPDARIYSYASCDTERAYGLETRTDVLSLARSGVTGYLNYALGRVYFYNPITGGFATEADHFTATNRFLAPMDQTHTMTAGVSYRHPSSGIWVGTAMEYGSGTPMGHGAGDHEHGEEEADHGHAESDMTAARVPGHVTADLSLGVDVFRQGNRQSRLSVQLDMRNVTDSLYLVAQEGELRPGQYSIPRLISLTAALAGRLYERLSPGGQLITAEVITDASPDVRAHHDAMWRQFMDAHGEDGQTWYAKHLAKDHPVEASTWICLLGDAGFVAAGCYWRYLNVAIFNARRPA